MDYLIIKLGLFWQYPVITEKTFHEQNKGDPNYFPFPWATVIDKRVNLQSLLEILKKKMRPNKNYYTCCQHIRYRELKQLWEALDINTVYIPHKCLNEDVLGSIKLIACPLYAVNIEDETRNEVFKQCNLSRSADKYTLRGFHYQSEKPGQLLGQHLIQFYPLQYTGVELQHLAYQRQS